MQITTVLYKQRVWHSGKSNDFPINTNTQGKSQSYCNTFWPKESGSCASSLAVWLCTRGLSSPCHSPPLFRMGCRFISKVAEKLQWDAFWKAGVHAHFQVPSSLLLFLPNSLPSCYRLNVCVSSSKFLHWSPTPQCGGIRGWTFRGQLGVDEVMRTGPHGGNNALIIRGVQTRAPHGLPPCHVRIQPEGSHLQVRKLALSQNWTCLPLDLGLPSLQRCEK